MTEAELAAQSGEGREEEPELDFEESVAEPDHSRTPAAPEKPAQVEKPEKVERADKKQRIDR